MTPAARLQAAIEVLEAWAGGTEGLDRVLARWGRASRYAGSKDRAAVADLAYDALRAPRSRQVRMGAGDPGPALADLAPRAVVLAGAGLAGAGLAGGVETLLRNDRHGPGPLTPDEKAALEAISASEATLGHDGLAPGVRFDMPDWLLDAFGEVPQQTALALRARAPLDLRVNTLKTDRAAAAAALAAEGVVAVPGPLSPTCLRVEAGARGVARTRTYADGLVEIQDAASQAAADFAGAEPGMTVVDLCAGGGGKTLALGAAMAGRGDLVAHDIDARRMVDLPPRAARAGLEVCAVDAEGLQAWEGRADLVFADAPCSGSGAWRRNPDARWRLTPARLSALTATQDAIIDRALGLLAPGGHLVFATCSFLPLEGPLRIDAAMARRPGLRLVDRGGDGGHFATLPDPEGGDGFFAARLGNSRTG